ncbi:MULTISPECIES: tetracycline resistance efflux system leader peptide [unclassified Bacillus (in: firmicutes)]
MKCTKMMRVQIQGESVSFTL